MTERPIILSGEMVPAAHCLDQRASSLRQVAAGMRSEYDDPSWLWRHG